jgi:hypothetical protein
MDMSFRLGFDNKLSVGMYMLLLLLFCLFNDSMKIAYCL